VGGPQVQDSRDADPKLSPRRPRIRRGGGGTRPSEPSRQR
jgi:hypothetical protein